MTYLWTACSFCYYMIMFQMKYLPGNIYVNTYANQFSEIFANVFTGVIYTRFGLKRSFTISYGISVVGSVLIIMFGSALKVLMPLFVILAKFGIATAFTLCYIGNVDVFPTLFSVTAMGICNFFARISTILAPEVAEVEAPVPMIIFCALSSLAIVVTQFVRPLKD